MSWDGSKLEQQLLYEIISKFIYTSIVNYLNLEIANEKYGQVNFIPNVN